MCSSLFQYMFICFMFFLRQPSSYTFILSNILDIATKAQLWICTGIITAIGFWVDQEIVWSKYLTYVQWKRYILSVVTRKKLHVNILKLIWILVMAWITLICLHLLHWDTLSLLTCMNFCTNHISLLATWTTIFSSFWVIHFYVLFTYHLVQ